MLPPAPSLKRQPPESLHVQVGVGFHVTGGMPSTSATMPRKKVQRHSFIILSNRRFIHYY